jgi:hypothetical protein
MREQKSKTARVPSEWDGCAESHSVLELRANEMVLKLQLDDALTEALDQLPEAEVASLSPWLLCYLALERRVSHADYNAALRYAQAALTRFACRGDRDGSVRALAEAAIARYHLGQYAIALAEISDYLPPKQPSCIAAMALAAYVNLVGINKLSAAIQAATWGLRALEEEPDTLACTTWRIVLQRNLAAAYHYKL